MVYLKYWPILKKLSEEVVTTIKIIYIYTINNDHIDRVIYVTNDNEVFSFDSTQREPQIIKELSNKSIIDLRAGSDFVIALSNNGNIYSWGSNSYGQLGICYEKSWIACCGYHCLALNSSGQIFKWGLINRINKVHDNNNIVAKPTVIKQFSDEKIIGIACGFNHSLALTESGIVYSWGENFYGQLGIGNDNSYQSEPIKVLIDIPIKRINTGYNHNLLLTDGGAVYVFGSNKSHPNHNAMGQLGVCSSITTMLLVPKRIETSIKFNDVIAMRDLSVALSLYGCHIWGDCDTALVKQKFNPTFVPIKCVYDLIATHSIVKVTHKPIVFGEDSSSGLNVTKDLNSCIGNSFNDAKNSDLKLKIEDSMIYCHKFILEARCKMFMDCIANDITDDNEVSLSEYSYSVYYAFLNYLYTDRVTIDTKLVVDLLELADKFSVESLNQKCVQLINTFIDTENVCDLYSKAISYCNQELELYCLQFTLSNFLQICSTDGFKKMDDSLSKKLLSDAIALK